MADNGLANLKKKLAAIPVAVRSAVMPALEKSGDELVGAQKSLAPVLSGELRNSIHAESKPDELKVIVTAGGEATTKDGYDYAKGTEFGTVNEHPEAFFWPAYRLLKKRMVGRTKRSINKAVKAEWNR